MWKWYETPKTHIHKFPLSLSGFGNENQRKKINFLYLESWRKIKQNLHPLEQKIIKTLSTKQWENILFFFCCIHNEDSFSVEYIFFQGSYCTCGYIFLIINYLDVRDIISGGYARDWQKMWHAILVLGFVSLDSGYVFYLWHWIVKVL